MFWAARRWSLSISVPLLSGNTEIWSISTRFERHLFQLATEYGKQQRLHHYCKCLLHYCRHTGFATFPIGLSKQMLVKLLNLSPTILCYKSRLLLFSSPLEKIKLNHTVWKYAKQNSFKTFNRLSPGIHSELCNLPKGSLESVLRIGYWLCKKQNQCWNRSTINYCCDYIWDSI